MRARILTTIVAIAAFALIGFGVPLAFAVTAAYRNETRFVLQREASEAAAEVLSDGSIDPDFPTPEPGTTLTVYGPTGERRHGEGPAEGDTMVRDAHDERDPVGGILDDEVVVAVPVLVNDQPVAVVRAATPAADVDHRILRTGAAIAALAAVVMACAVVVAWWQSRRLAQPLVRLADAASRLGYGDFLVHNAPSGIPEVDSVADALDRTAERLGRLIERERAFSADVSHQLRTPLTALCMALELARDTPGTDPHAAIETALANADRLWATIDELLALARDITDEHGHADLTTALAVVDADWRTPLNEHGRRLVLDIPAALPPLPFSDTALRHVLDVLLTNSAEHGAGTVTIRARPEPSRLVIEVSDEGPGLTDPETAFTRRADGHRHHGIGLALARTLVEAEGGRLDYHTESHQFRLSIPTPPPVTFA